MKILHVIPSYIPAYQHGGSIKGVHDLCRMLAKKGHQVSVFTTNSDRNKKLDVSLGRPHLIDGIEVTYYPVQFFRNYYYSPSMSKALKVCLKEFDLVHIHSVFLYPTYAASYWCRKMKIPYLINPFGALDPDMIKFKNAFFKKIYIKLIEATNIKGAAAVHLASEYEKKCFLSLGFNVPTAVIARGIFLEEYDRSLAGESLQTIYPQLNGNKIVLFLGRLHPKKGLENLGLAFKEIAKKRGDIYLVVAGTGENKYVREVKSFYDKLGISNKTVFTGMLLGKEKLSAFYGSDIFVLSSYGENFGIAALEAMACQLPVIVSNRVGLSTYVDYFKTGLVINNHQKQIIEAIEKLLSNKSLLNNMAINCSKFIKDEFCIEKIANQMSKTYKKIINEYRYQN